MMCKYKEQCEKYSEESNVCNKNGGGYYEDLDGFRPAGCYRSMEEKDE